MKQAVQIMTENVDYNYKNMESIFQETIQSLAQEIKNSKHQEEPQLPLSPALFSPIEDSILISPTNHSDLKKSTNLEDRIREKMQHTQPILPRSVSFSNKEEDDLFADDSTMIQEEEEQVQPVPKKRCKRR